MKKKKIILLVLFIMMILIILSLSVAFLYINNAIKSVKNMNIRLTNNEYNYSKIFDANGNELTFSEKLEDNYIPLDQINMETRQAFLSIEDKQFYKHKGLNYKRIAKAMLNNLKSKNLGEGASTITQQLVKNRFLTNEKTFDRKLKEAYLSKKLEKIETKDKILETYLNTIYFGNGAYGIGNASKTFFDKERGLYFLSDCGRKIFSQLGNAVAVLAEVNKKLDNGMLMATNKKDITNIFFDRMIKYCLAESEDSKGIEFETKAGTLTFRKKEGVISGR